jgi:uncharacterized repeat protein (TIGR03803 family)
MNPRTALARIFVFAVAAAVSCSFTQAQTFSVIHHFTGAADGATPYGAVSLDQQGNLYGTASAGGFTGNNCTNTGCGTVFKLTHRGANWIFTPLYSFQGNSDGITPLAGVTIGPNGSLYGTTNLGGSFGEGTAYNLRPPARFTGNILGGWTNHVIYDFGVTGVDSRQPGLGSVIFDPAGKIYGTTIEGGIFCDDGGTCGTVYTLTPSGGGWTESYFAFPGGSGGSLPLSGVVRDSAGNLYGTTDIGNNNPVAYQLTPSGQGWTETTLYTFGELSDVRGGVILNGAGGLYGGDLDGNVYQLSPSGGQWTYSLLFNFPGGGIWGPLVRDVGGNLYGATCSGGSHGNGSVFKLTSSGGGWTATDLYDFTGGSDGTCPVGGIARDASGNLYGTTLYGGSGCGAAGCGVVWEVTP